MTNPSAGSGTNNNGSDRIDLLLDQMGRLTELVAATNLNITSGFARTSTNIDRVMEAIAQSSAEQNGKIDQLIAAIERSEAKQTKAIDKLGEKIERLDAKQNQTVDRLVGLVEQLLRDRVQNN